MKLTLPALIFLIALGFIANSGLCAYVLPLAQVDSRCYWWRGIPAQLTEVQH